MICREHDVSMSGERISNVKRFVNFETTDSGSPAAAIFVFLAAATRARLVPADFRNVSADRQIQRHPAVSVPIFSQRPWLARARGRNIRPGGRRARRVL